MADSAYDIASRGLALVGMPAVTAFDATTRESAFMAVMYEARVRALLTRHRWTFARKQETLTASAQVPVGRWDLAYELPSDCLIVRAFTLLDVAVEYDLSGDFFLYANLTTTDEPVLDYTYRLDEQYFPPYFTEVLEWDLAAIAALGIARKSELAAVAQQMYAERLQLAMSNDSQQATAKRMSLTRFIANR